MYTYLPSIDVKQKYKTLFNIRSQISLHDEVLKLHDITLSSSNLIYTVQYPRCLVIVSHLYMYGLIYYNLNVYNRHYQETRLNDG